MSLQSLKLVAVAKDEAAYIAEWIYHHLYIGVKEIDVYLNGTEDNSFLICRRISRYYKQVNFFQADELLRVSLKTKKDFQRMIYDYAIENEKYSRRFSHLLFLDIDEYLMPERFGNKINSLLEHNAKADVVSFLWHSDLPSMQRKAFSPVIEQSMHLKKMRQLKSMCRINGAAERSKLHSFIVSKKNEKTAKFQLTDGSYPEFFHFKKRISDEDIKRLSGRFEPWFVYHRIFRSHDEYCASLLKGRMHRNNKLTIKDNRYGYCTNNDGVMRVCGEELTYRIYWWQFMLYRLKYEVFLWRADLKPSIKKGQAFVAKRYKKLLKLLKKQPHLRKQYCKQFRATRFECTID